MAETANTHDSHPIGRFYICGQRCKHSNASAQKWTRRRTFEPLRDRNCPSPVRTQPLGKTALMSNNGRRRFRAEVVVTGYALMAVHATARIPAHPHPLPDLQSLGALPHRGYPADCLMSRYHRALSENPIMIQY